MNGQKTSMRQTAGGRYSLNCGYLPFNVITSHMLQFNANLWVAKPLFLCRGRQRNADTEFSHDTSNLVNVFWV